MLCYVIRLPYKSKLVKKIIYFFTKNNMLSSLFCKIDYSLPSPFTDRLHFSWEKAGFEPRTRTKFGSG